jgi:endonuclease IV
MDRDHARIGVHFRTDNASISKLKNNIPELEHVQLFTHGPGSSKPITDIDADLVDNLARLNISINVHGSYLSVPWNSPFLFKHTLANFRSAHAIGATNVVLHIPFLPIEQWLPTITKLAHVIEKEKLTPKICLEQSPTICDKTRSYESAPKLNRLWRAIKAAGIQHCTGICIDTAHVHAGGAQIHTYAQAKTYLDMLDPQCLILIHLNGNSVVPGIKKTNDIHEIPLHVADLIWGEFSYIDSGCRAFVEYAAAHGIQLVVEWNTKKHTVKMLRQFLDQIHD